LILPAERLVRAAGPAFASPLASRRSARRPGHASRASTCIAGEITMSWMRFGRSFKDALSALAAVCLGLTGCAGFHEDMTSYHPHGDNYLDHFGHRISLVMFPPKPQEVLAKSRNNDLRARAYRQIWEPLETRGGTQKEQDIVVRNLIDGIRTERSGHCRAAAVQTLGEFKDPRAKEFFIQCFKEKEQVAFLDRDPIVRIAALQVAAKLRDPIAVDILAEAARFDPLPEVRIVAIQGLGNYPNQQAVAVLLEELKKEEQKEVRHQDVAIRHTIGESLDKITGKQLPARAEAWEQYLAGSPQLAPQRGGNPLVRLATWVTGE